MTGASGAPNNLVIYILANTTNASASTLLLRRFYFDSSAVTQLRVRASCGCLQTQLTAIAAAGDRHPQGKLRRAQSVGQAACSFYCSRLLGGGGACGARHIDLIIYGS